MGTDARWVGDEGARVAPVEASRSPLELVAPGAIDPWAARWVGQVTLGFVVVGVLLRVVRYLLKYPLWCDESMLAANFLDRGYLDLFRPLDFRQVSPLLFSLIELSAVKLLGFSELTLRLFPFVCGVASVPLFRHVAGRVLGGVPLLLAVAIFAVTEWPIRYAAEVKPYSSDLFVALGLLALALEWYRTPERVGWLWALAVAGPLAVGLSFPAILVTGGIGLGLLPLAWRSTRRDVRIAYVTYGLLVVLAFVLLLGTYKTAPQDHDYFHHDWAAAFPPLNSVWGLAAWFVSINTGAMFAYPAGGARGLSTLSFACFVVAAVVLWRRGRRMVLALCLLPFAMALVAAAMHRYPYGMSVRTMQYVAPTICLLTGLGAAAVVARIPSPRARRDTFRGLVIALAALGMGRMVYDLTHPYKYATDERTRAFARWFWDEMSQTSEVICARDLGAVLDTRHWGRDATDSYLCYRKIYSPPNRLELNERLAAVSAKRPLRCVFFNEVPWKSPRFESWMQGMLQRYELQKLVRYPISLKERKPGPTWHTLYLVYEFVPRADGVALSAAETAAAVARR